MTLAEMYFKDADVLLHLAEMYFRVADADVLLHLAEMYFSVADADALLLTHIHAYT